MTDSGQPRLFAGGVRSRVSSPVGAPVSIGPVLRLLDEGLLSEDSPGQVVIPHKLLADTVSLPQNDLKALGLPSPGPFSVEVSTRRLLTDSDFWIEGRLWLLEGRPAMGANRCGALVQLGDRWHTLRDPLYQLLQAIEGFQQAPPADVDGRLRWWAGVQELLPEGAQVDRALRSMRIAVAESLTLHPFINARGEPDFDPVPGRRKLIGDDLEVQSTAFQESLPLNKQRDFATRFRASKSARERYILGDDWFVVLAPPLQKALSRVRELQQAPVEARREVLLRPRAYIRQALEGALDEDAIEAVFYDEDYGNRVKGIGIWKPKVLPWITISGIQWIPGEPAPPGAKFGLQFGDTRVELSAEELPEAADKLEQAVSAGSPTFEINGKLIPATEEAKQALEELTKQAMPARPDRKGKGEAGGDKPRTAVVLLIDDHLEALGNSCTASPRQDDWGKSLGDAIKSRFLQHQEACLGWLQQHWQSGSRGALLADDMGLGKTFSTLAFLRWLRLGMQRDRIERQPFLVVAPTGLLKNWQDEHEQHLDAPGLGEVCRAYGQHLSRIRSADQPRAVDIRVGAPSLDLGQLRQADWVLTTYETLRDYQHSFAKVHWAVVVFDEAQRIKNPAAAVTDAAKALEAKFRLAVTGTPVENRLADLWCIVDAIQPGSLGTLREFSHGVEAEASKPEVLQSLHDRLLEKNPPTVAIRRLKDDHLAGLPEREEHELPAEMPPDQASAYDAAVSAALAGAGSRSGMLTALQALRRVSLHPTCTLEGSDEAFIQASARVRVLVQTLDAIAEKGEKALLFVEMLDVQGILVELLQRRYRLIAPPLVINGEVPGDRRKERVDDFQKRRGFDIMLLSPRAGGVGLTLTAANHVIHLSRWWNPAVEDQCSDRVYRIGQSMPVHIYYPLAIHPRYREGSFDMRLSELLGRKRELSRRMLAPPALSTEELAALYRSAVSR